MPRLRSSEWLLIAYFGYVAFISPFFPLEARVTLLPFAVFVLVSVLFGALAYAEVHASWIFFSMTRDWTPIALMLVAYREMDWFSPLPRNYHLELEWVKWDRLLLDGAGLRQAIESLGWPGPLYLEFCYLLVYAVGPFVVAVLYFEHHRERVNSVVFFYLLGTLLSYALFPYFPSDLPPRSFCGSGYAARGDGAAAAESMARERLRNPLQRFPQRACVVGFLGGVGVASLSSGKRKRFGYLMLVYAISVAVATVYGRYHYAADVLAGFAVSLAPALTILLSRWGLLRLRGLPSPP